MNRKLDPRLMFEPEPLLRSVIAEPARRTWLPALVPADAAVDPQYWLSRAARGFSWHRSGRALSRGTRQ